MRFSGPAWPDSKDGAIRVSTLKKKRELYLKEYFAGRKMNFFWNFTNVVKMYGHVWKHQREKNNYQNALRLLPSKAEPAAADTNFC